MPIHNFDDLINKYDDLKVISNNLSDCKGFTLTGIICNEMYFLPSFLAYYRRLGVERFVFIDDHSIDGTREYLACQDDVMVLGSSNSRYSDQIDIPLSVDGSLMNIRIALFGEHFSLANLPRLSCLCKWMLMSLYVCPIK